VAVALVAVLASLYVGFKLLMIARAVAGAVQLLNIAFLANPVVAVVAGVVALAAALVIAYKKSETFRDIVNRVGGVLKSVLMPIFNAVKSAIEAIGALLRGDLGGFLSKIGEVLKNLLEAGLKSVLALPTFIAVQAIKLGADIIEKIAEGAKDIAVKVWDAIKNLVTDLAANVGSWATGLLNIGKSVVSGLVSGVSGLAQAIWDKIAQMPKALIGLVAGWFSGLVDIGGKVVDFVVSGVSGLAQAVWNKIIGFPAALGRLVVGWFTGDEGLPTIGGKVIGWIASGITGLAAAAWDNIKGFPGALVNKLGDWAQALKDIGVKILEGIAAGITGAPGALIAAVGRALGIDTQGPPANVPAVLDPVANWTARRDRAFDDLAADFKRPGSQGGTKITPAEQALLKRRQQAWLRDNPRPAAIGGIFTGPVNSLVGEAGDEAVIPLERPSGRQALAEALELAGGGGRSMVVNLTFNGVLDAREAARVIQPELNRLVSVAY
jgi:phage-related protein